jgi:hypothetical protein
MQIDDAESDDEATPRASIRHRRRLGPHDSAFSQTTLPGLKPLWASSPRLSLLHPGDIFIRAPRRAEGYARENQITEGKNKKKCIPCSIQIYG